MLTQQILKNILHYNSETGVFTWKLLDKLVKTVKPGDIAGTYDSENYRIIRYKKKGYKSHRLAFLYMTGSIPNQVDHINHVTSDNRWCNLRPANAVINSKNKSLAKNNKSGCSGVYWRECDKRWISNIKVDYKQIYIGIFLNKKDAIKARKSAEIKYKFHENHGL